MCMGTLLQQTNANRWIPGVMSGSDQMSLACMRVPSLVQAPGTSYLQAPGLVAKKTLQECLFLLFFPEGRRKKIKNAGSKRYGRETLHTRHKNDEKTNEKKSPTPRTPFSLQSSAFSVQNDQLGWPQPTCIRARTASCHRKNPNCFNKLPRLTMFYSKTHTN